MDLENHGWARISLTQGRLAGSRESMERMRERGSERREVMEMRFRVRSGLEEKKGLRREREGREETYLQQAILVPRRLLG